jgi:SAM-dependent methyltransferase
MIKLKSLLNRSPKYYYCWLQARSATEDAMASMDWREFDKLKEFRRQTVHPNYRKYFNMKNWLRRNMQRAYFLGLAGTQERWKVLDIGTGFGYFLHAAEYLGHYGVGIDLPGDKLFNEARKFLGVHCIDHRIEPFECLPDSIGNEFDLITAFQICFNNHYSSNPWGEAEWEFWVDNAMKGQMKGDGRLYLEFNYHSKTKDWMTRRVRHLFKKKYKAQFFGYSRVIVTKTVE